MIFLCLILGGANGIYLTMDTSLAVDHLPDDMETSDDSDDDGNDAGANSSGNAQLLGVWGVAGKSS